MTSAATFMAAVPPALGLGAGSEIRSPMAIAVLGGLVVSTALSLIVVPSFYVELAGWLTKLGTFLRRTPKPAAEHQPEAE
jgi:multidrug efflux pump subunit AcrB